MRLTIRGVNEMRNVVLICSVVFLFFLSGRIMSQNIDNDMNEGVTFTASEMPVKSDFGIGIGNDGILFRVLVNSISMQYSLSGVYTNREILESGCGLGARFTYCYFENDVINLASGFNIKLEDTYYNGKNDNGNIYNKLELQTFLTIISLDLKLPIQGLIVFIGIDVPLVSCYNRVFYQKDDLHGISSAGTSISLFHKDYLNWIKYGLVYYF